MLCLRCGVCCVKFRNNILIDGKWRSKPRGIACHYLRFEGATAICLAYHEPWRKETACWRFVGLPRGGPEREFCTMGMVVRRNGGLPGVFARSPDLNLVWEDPDEMEVCADSRTRPGRV